MHRQDPVAGWQARCLRPGQIENENDDDEIENDDQLSANDESSKRSGQVGGESLWPVTMLIFVCVLFYGKKLLIFATSHQTFVPIVFGKVPDC